MLVTVQALPELELLHFTLKASHKVGGEEVVFFQADFFFIFKKRINFTKNLNIFQSTVQHWACLHYINYASL